MATHPVKKPPMAVQSEPQSLEEQIRHRAYELYEERGREYGTISTTGFAPRS